MRHGVALSVKGNFYKCVCLQPNSKSNPNPNATAKQHTLIG